MISIIVAMDEKRGIGKDNKLLWHIPEDLQRFKKLTSGHPIIMGRKTYESIGRVLPNRTNIIVTRDQSYNIPGAIICHSLNEAIQKSEGILKPASQRGERAQDDTKKEIFIIGGGQIFQQALPLASKLYLTIVEGNFDADTFFPDYSEFNKIVKREKKQNEHYKYSFLVLERY